MSNENLHAVIEQVALAKIRGVVGADRTIDMHTYRSICVIVGRANALHARTEKLLRDIDSFMHPE